MGTRTGRTGVEAGVELVSNWRRIDVELVSSWCVGAGGFVSFLFVLVGRVCLRLVALFCAASASLSGVAVAV